MQTKEALEAQARRAAKKFGLVAKKSRWRANTRDNLGGFMLVNAYTNSVEAGERFDLSAEEVLEYCKY